ncbi:MAG: hypothetical protein ACRBCK_00980 [Alphaproteobacteria bacterium]
MFMKVINFMSVRFFIYAALSVFIVGGCLSSNVSAQVDDGMLAPQFFSVLKDVPLMTGLSELPDRAVSFDKPEGQIVEVVAQMGVLSQDELIAFYDVALPQFGWSKTTQGVFFRRNEFLEISFEQIGGQEIVKVMVRPTL